MKAAAWIDRVKSARGLESDYAVAKALEIGRATVSRYRKHDTTLDDATAIKVATALGEKPERILVDQVAERATDPQTRAVWSAVAARLQSGFAHVRFMLIVALFSIAASAGLAWLATYSVAASANGLYIMLNKISNQFL